MIRIEAVSKKYPSGTYGVRDLSLTIPSGVLGVVWMFTLAVVAISSEKIGGKN